MTNREITLIKEMLRKHGQWCRGTEARDDSNEACQYDDKRAIAFSLDGALFRVLGPHRALEEIGAFTAHMTQTPIERFPHPKGTGRALRAIMDYNDGETTFKELTDRLTLLKATA